MVNPRIHQFYQKNLNFKYSIYKFFFLKLLKNQFLKELLINDILFYNFSKKFFNIKKISYFNEPVEEKLILAEIKDLKIKYLKF